MIAVSTLAACGGQRPVSFRADVQPILDAKCVSCHPASYPYLDLRAGRAWAQLVRVPAATASAYERVIPGNPELSYLLIHPPDPSRKHLLSGAERDTIAEWIRQGAPDN